MAVRDLAPHQAVEPGIRAAAMLAPLSGALDTAEGQEPGHAVRTALISLRIGEALGMSDVERGMLAYVALLKDLGGSANAALLSRLFEGDDREIKRSWRLTDWAGTRDAAGRLFDCGRPGSSRLSRTWHVRLSRSGFADAGREMMVIRSDRGRALALRLGMPSKVAEAIAAVEEHWDGNGMPRGIRASGIPMMARVVSLAQTVEVFTTAHGLRAAYGIAHSRRGRWFDPVVVDCLDAFQMDSGFWAGVVEGDATALLLTREPEGMHRILDRNEVDTIPAVFADIVDAKRPCREGHSRRVADLAVAIGAGMGLSGRERKILRRAGLLHDLGILAVSSTVLEKVDPLGGEEMDAIRGVVDGAASLIARIPRFETVAGTVRAHTERLDGSGYPDGCTGDSIPRLARILAVADVADALGHERPNRRGLSPVAVIARLGEMAAAGKLCRTAVDVAGEVIASLVPAE